MTDAMKLAIRHKKDLKKDLKKLAEAAEVMLELLTYNAPLEGLYGSDIEEWEILIDEAKK